MKIILVTSEANYVKDNYLSLVKKLTDRKELPDGVEISALVLIKTVSLKLFLKMCALMLTGVFYLPFTLIKNMFNSLFFDPRVKHCESLGIPVLKFENINGGEAIEKLRELSPELIVNIRTRNIYKKEILSLPKIGCVNLHHGILPENRGTMCDLWAWYEGRPVGFSLHWMNEKIDDGNIIEVCSVNVEGVDNYIEIPMLSSSVEAKAVIDLFSKILKDGKNIGKPNICEKVNYTRNPNYREIRAIKARGLKL